METFSTLLAFFAGNSPVTGEFLRAQRPVTRSFDFTLIWAWINAWVNNRKAGDLRRHRAHYDVIVMSHLKIYIFTWLYVRDMEGLLCVKSMVYILPCLW